MALNISAWSIQRPLPPIVGTIVVMLLGALSFSNLPITRLPNVDVPVISVTVAQFGAAPVELESQVTKIIEDGVSGVDGAHHILLSITDGISNTTIQLPSGDRYRSRVQRRQGCRHARPRGSAAGVNEPLI